MNDLLPFHKSPIPAKWNSSSPSLSLSSSPPLQDASESFFAPPFAACPPLFQPTRFRSLDKEYGGKLHGRRGRRAAKVQPPPRNVSRRLDAEGKSCSQKDLVRQVNLLNAQLGQKARHKNVGSMTVPQLDDILDNATQALAQASLQTLHDAAKHRLTQPVCRAVCIRILTLLAKDPVLLDLYKDSVGASVRLQLEAGNDPTVHAGAGISLNHAYHAKLNLAFNDATNCSDFPFDYIPGCERKLYW
jgi:hypothetical protein